MITDETSLQYFESNSIDVNAWVRAYIQVDKTIRQAFYTSALDADSLIASVNASLMQNITSTLSSVFTNDAQVQNSLADLLSAHVKRIRAEDRDDLLLNLHEALRTTSNDTISQRLTDLLLAHGSTTGSLETFRQDLRLVLQDSTEIKALTQKVGDYVLRYETANSKRKGNMAENDFFEAADKYFQMAEILRRHCEGKAADFEIIQPGRDPVIIDVKRHSQKVNKEHLTKFYRDVRASGKHGVLYSTLKGIATKQHLQFDVIDNRYVCVYVCNANNDMHLLETALNIVHWVDSTIKRLTTDDVAKIQPDVLASICDDLQRHLQRLNDLRDLHERTSKIINDMLTLSSVHTTLLNCSASAPPPRSPHAPKPNSPPPSQPDTNGDPELYCQHCQHQYYTAGSYNNHGYEAGGYVKGTLKNNHPPYNLVRPRKPAPTPQDPPTNIVTI